MAQTSRLADAEDGLLAVILARAAIPGNALEGVTIQLGDPGSALEPDHVWILEDASADQHFDLTTGPGAEEREETIILQVRCFTQRRGDDFLEQRTRVQAMSAEVEIAVRGDRSLSGKVFDAEVLALDRDGKRTSDTRTIHNTVRVQAKAYLS